MKNKLIFITLLLSVFSLPIIAQEFVTHLDSGINVAVFQKTTPVLPVGQFNRNLEWSVTKYANINKVSRALIDKKNKLIFAYDIEIKQSLALDKFSVSIKSDLNSFKFFTRFLNYEKKLLTTPPDNILINDGDIIALDILENPKTKMKVRHLIKITREYKPAWGYFAELDEPRNFALKDVRLQLVDFKSYINEKPIENNHIRSVVGLFVGLKYKGRGTFFLSPFRGEGYGFKKIGIIDDNKIIIKHKGDIYKIVSKTSILGMGKRWNLWGMYKPESKMEKNMMHRLSFKVFYANTFLGIQGIERLIRTGRIGL